MRTAVGVLALIGCVLDWQDRMIEEIAVEVDGEAWVPDWVLGGDQIPIPAHRLQELLDEARTR